MATWSSEERLLTLNKRQVTVVQGNKCLRLVTVVNSSITLENALEEASSGVEY